MLNCTLVGTVIEGYVVDNHLSAHPIDNIVIPRFDGGVPLHSQLAALSHEAHRAAATGDQAAIGRAEREIDRIVPALWKK